MKTSKFIQFLSRLDKRAVNKFDKFLQSDYHDMEPKTRELWAYLLPLYPDFEVEAAMKSRAAKAIYGHEKHSKRITDRLAELSKVMQDFLMLEYLKKDDTAQAFLMLDVLKSQDMGRRFTGLQLNHIDRLLGREPRRNMTHYYRQFRLGHERYYHGDTANAKGNPQIYLNEAMARLNEFHHLARLRHIYEMQNRERVYNEDYGLTDEVMNTLQRDIANIDNPLADIYEHLLRLSGVMKDADYQVLKKKVLKYFDVGSHREQGNLLTFLINYQSGRNKAGHKDALAELLSLYRFGLEKSVFMDGRYWSIAHFMNVVVLACELQETDWAADFYTQNINKLPVKSTKGVPYRKKFRLFCESCINLALGSYQRAVSQASLVRTAGELGMNLQSWTVEIRAHYELRKETAQIEEKLQSFSSFLETNKANLSDDNYKANKRFVQMLKKMLRAEYKDRYTKADLIHQLEWEEGYIVCKRWLRLKVEELD